MKEGISLYRYGRDQGDCCSQEYRAKISVDRAKLKLPTLSEPLGDKALDMDWETSPQDVRGRSKGLSLNGLRTSLQSSASRDGGLDCQPGSSRSRFMIARDRSRERKKSVSQMTGHLSQSESIHRYSCTDQERSDSQMTSCYSPSAESMCGYSCKTHSGEGTKLPSVTLARRSQALLPLQRNHVPPSLLGHTQESSRPVRHPVTHSHTF